MASAPPSFAIHQVTEVSDVELQAVEKVLAEAFRDDPFTQTVTAEDASVYGALYASTIVAALLSGSGEVYFAENAEKDIVGVAVWFLPGREMYDTEDQRAKALGPLMGRFSPELQAWWVTVFLPTYAELAVKQLGEGTKVAAWHLQTFAVSPQFQRKGVGRALVEVVKKKAFEAGKVLVVETSTAVNVDIYQKLGFKVKGEPGVIQGLTRSYNAWSLLAEPTTES